MATETLTFEEVLKAEESAGGKTHCLLGNGFSRAIFNDIFSYDALLDKADFSSLTDNASKAFGALGTTDFEEVIRALRAATTLLRLYGPGHRRARKQMRQDADGLREVLVEAIASSHPGRPADIRPRQYEACREFLSNFDRIYTVNYDLLLYWAVMQDELAHPVRGDDGFRTPEDGEEAWVSWDPSAGTRSQTIYYLHGALHLFDAGHELQKYTWINTGLALMDQIRAALQAEKYPLFVAEGESEAKYAKIQHSAYLAKCERSLLSIGGGLVIFGHSLARSDDHILRMIRRNSTLQRVYVSIHGAPESKANLKTQRRASLLEQDMRRRQCRTVEFFDAETANVWG